MPDSCTNLAILGSTGSIGRSTLAVVGAADGALQAIALSAHRDFSRLVEQARAFRPRWVVASDAEAAASFDWSGLPADCQLLTGSDGLEYVVRLPETEIVVAAIVGSAGLRSTWAALDAGKRVALANKETLVMGGPLVMRLAHERRGQIIPVDSEHSAVFQALKAGR
ncbi:MAG: 1-deoxy-D-xylulose-5-phosphate reductoisomerase, partial [Pirellulaceae bacterium]|nr:1-deoxy-D-xylulose-5-phosphate reductoisomerase [Pirellulaceae bacterium]